MGGVVLLTWVVFQAGFGVGVLVRRLAGVTTDVRLAAAGLIAVAAVTALSVIAPRGHGTGVFLDVAAVQGGGEQGTRADDVPSAVVTRRHLDATRAIEPDEELDLVLWPENVVDVIGFAGSTELSAIAEEAARLGVPISVGVTEDVPGERDRFTNAQVIVTPDGDVPSRYDKVRRVPFGEYVPLRSVLDAVGAPVDQVPNDAVPGTEPAYLDLPDGTRLGVAISWEVFFGGRVRDGVREGAEVVVNPTNGASYSGTILQSQQIASSRLRALETGRWVVQAAPTGFSTFVSPDGDVLDRTAVSERAVIRHDVELRRGHTLYTRVGDAPVIPSWCSAWRRRGGCRLEEHRHRPVVDERHPHVGTEPPGRHGGAEVAQRGDDVFDERLGVLRTSSGDPTRTTAGRCVPVQRELADDENLGAQIACRSVHHASVIVEHPQVPQLAGGPLGVALGVVVGDAHQHAQPAADRPDGLDMTSVGRRDGHRCVGHSLHHRSHAAMPTTNPDSAHCVSERLTPRRRLTHAPGRGRLRTWPHHDRSPSNAPARVASPPSTSEAARCRSAPARTATSRRPSCCSLRSADARQSTSTS